MRPPPSPPSLLSFVYEKEKKAVFGRKPRKISYQIQSKSFPCCFIVLPLLLLLFLFPFHWVVTGKSSRAPMKIWKETARQRSFIIFIFLKNKKIKKKQAAHTAPLKSQTLPLARTRRILIFFLEQINRRKKKKNNLNSKTISKGKAARGTYTVTAWPPKV